MASDVVHADDFIAYPTNRVVGTIPDQARARAAIEALLQFGFAREDIEILQGEADLHRPPSAGAEHGFLAQFQRTLARKLAGEYKHLRLGEEFEHLRHFVDDLRAGRTVIMVLAKRRERREAAVDILCAHGAKSVEFYGRWSWQPLEPNQVHDPVPGRTYEAHLAGSATRIRLDSESQATILGQSAGPAAGELAHLPVTQLRPRLLMLAWQEADRTSTVQIYDFESGAAHAIIGSADGRVQRASGTVRRVD